MKIVMDRNYCDAFRSFCARCSAAFVRKPDGTDRPCVIDIIDDGNDEVLKFELRGNGQTLKVVLTDEAQQGLAREGWEFLAELHPSYLRAGAAERWRQLAVMAAHT
jgi:hypothetical protein